MRNASIISFLQGATVFSQNQESECLTEVRYFTRSIIWRIGGILRDLVVRLVAKLQHFLHLPHGIANQGLHVLCWKRHGQKSIRNIAHVQVIASGRQSPTLLGHQTPDEADPKHASANTGSDTPGYSRPILLSQSGPRCGPLSLLRPSRPLCSALLRRRRLLVLVLVLLLLLLLPVMFSSFLELLSTSLSRTIMFPAANTSPAHLLMLPLLHPTSSSSSCTTTTTTSCVLASEPQ
jgi:hypothetical protein